MRDITCTAQIAEKQVCTFVHMGLAHQIIAVGFNARAGFTQTVAARIRA